MTQHTYDNESVQELLNWAKKMLETKNYPTEKYELNKCTTIINGKTYLESLVAMIGRNWENPTFHPTIDQLWEFREKWEGKEENKKLIEDAILYLTKLLNQTYEIKNLKLKISKPTILKDCIVSLSN